MKVRGTIAGTPLSARLTALCWGALTLLAPVAVSACTSGTSTAPPTVFSPSVTTGTAPALRYYPLVRQFLGIRQRLGVRHARRELEPYAVVSGGPW